MNPVNIPAATQAPAQRIWQLLTNVGEELIGQLGAIQNGEVLNYRWPSNDVVEFMRPFNGRGKLTFHNIHETGYESISWANEEVIGRADEFEVIDRIEGFPKGSMYTQRHTYSFGAVETLLDVTKEGFETEAKARLGSISTPAGAELAQTVTSEFQKQRGNNHNWQQTLERTFNFPIQEDFEIRAVRQQEKRRVHVVGVPRLDYSIEWGRYWANGAYDRVQVASLDEFLQLLGGNAPDSVGVMYVHRPGEVTFSGQDWTTTSSPTAGFYRAKPQPSAEVLRSSEAVSFVREYPAVLSQGFRYFSLTDGAYKDVPTGAE